MASALYQGFTIRQTWLDDIAVSTTLPRRPVVPSPATRPQSAKQVLRDLLSPEDWQHYSTQGHIHVQGSRGGEYKLHRERQGNVWQVGNASRLGRPLCILLQSNTAPALGYPIELQLAAQVLLLRTDEQEFLDIALPA